MKLINLLVVFYEINVMTVVLFVGEPDLRLQMSAQIMHPQVIMVNITSQVVVNDLQTAMIPNTVRQKISGKLTVVVIQA